MTLVEFLLARIAEDEEAADLPRQWWVPGYLRDGAGYFVAEVNPTPILGLEWQPGETIVLAGPGRLQSRTTEHIARWDPARVLAECEAKRQIVELHALVVQAGEPEPICDECSDDYRGPKYSGPCATLRLLALPHTNHPDYDEAWRP